LSEIGALIVGALDVGDFVVGKAVIGAFDTGKVVVGASDMGSIETVLSEDGALDVGSFDVGKPVVGNAIFGAFDTVYGDGDSECGTTCTGDVVVGIADPGEAVDGDTFGTSVKRETGVSEMEVGTMDDLGGFVGTEALVGVFDAEALVDGKTDVGAIV
jgi:hypothetical protein